MLKMLDIYAGETAKKTIEEQGINQNIFDSFLGASGGPKWFCLFALDKYLFGEFFKERSKALNIIGSSVGAFRASCFAQQDPVAAIDRMAMSYSESRFLPKAKPQEITNKAKAMLEFILNENGVSEILNNKTFKVHFLVNKAKGLVASKNSTLQMLGLIKSFGLNFIDRKLIKNQYERYVFKHPQSNLVIDDYCQFATHYINLTQDNLMDALLASGSIPLVMESINHINGAARGSYLDGGILDYHFDISFNSMNGLILYPHFSATPKAGWFDKNLKRSVQTQNYDSIVMLVPSKQFIDSLPFSKIPDRKDFANIPDKERIKYWKTVMKESTRLSDEFAAFCDKPNLSLIKSI